jgi:hypothetical protein
MSSDSKAWLIFALVAAVFTFLFLATLKSPTTSAPKADKQSIIASEFGLIA